MIDKRDPVDQNSHVVSLYDYTDYRAFLRDRFTEAKKRNPLFSYRSFNKVAGIRSSAFLKFVIDGKRNLADRGIRKICRGFHLNEMEGKYFNALVKFNQAADVEEKDHYFRILSQNRKFIAAKPLTAVQYRLFTHWYYVAILEMVRLEIAEVKDVGWLKSGINPPVGRVAIKKAVKDLKELGLLSEEKNGNLKRNETMLMTEDQFQSLALTNFHTQMSEIASQKVLKARPEDREFSALTVATSEKGFQESKRRIQQLSDLLHSSLEQETGEPKTIVGHFNFQLFKLNQ